MTEQSNHQFDYIEGIVLAERTNRDMVVSGQVSSDWQGRASGNITSHTIITQEFWLRQNNGQEVHISLGASTVPLREGHSVIVVSMYGVNALLYIKNTNMWYMIGLQSPKISYGVGVVLAFLSLSLGFLVSTAIDSQPLAVLLWLFCFAAPILIIHIINEKREKENEYIKSEVSNFLQKII